MLKSEELDRESFEDIFRHSVEKIRQWYPEWSDYNDTDPGMMILELMSWFTEVSEYHLNVIADNHYRKYLKLLGKVPKSRKPARTWLQISGLGRISQNTRFYAEDIPFETEYEIDVSGNEILSIQSGKDCVENKNRLFSDFRSKFVFYPFGAENENQRFEITLKNPLAAGETAGVYIQIKPWKNTSPLQEGFLEYVKYHGEIFRDGWKKDIEILEDETKGFCQSGVLLFRVKKKSGFESGSRISFIIDGGEYPVKPAITGILWNVVPALQKCTINRRTDLGETYGICNHRIKFEEKECIPKSLELYVEEKNGCSCWKLVDDFTESDAWSRHFCFDEKRGEIIFGDGEHGKPPKGNVFLKKYETTRGLEGNIKEFMLQDTTKEENWRAVNILPAEGGRNRQEMEECFEELIMEQENPERCVTLEDYENAVRNTPGVPIRRVRAFPGKEGDNTIFIAVEGETQDGTLNQGCMENLKAHILPQAMIGTRVIFVKPRYTKLHIFMEISVHSYAADCEEMTREAVLDYFGSDRIFFGGVIKGNQVSRYIYGLPWIQGIRTLEFSVSGNTGKSDNGRDVILEDECLPHVESVTIRIIG